MSDLIPFNRPFIAGKELYYIAQAVTMGNLGGDGTFTTNCCKLLEQQFGIHKVLLTPSCTAALEMAAILCDLGPGDEVILPSFTFVSTATSVIRTGARPIFVDIRPDTLNLDVALVEGVITPKTKAIIPVHYAGIGCEMDTIMDLASRHKFWVIEDAAQAVNSFYRQRPLGSIGHLGAYSFHETKNYICGEGGALCINVPEFVERAEIIRDKGTNRKQFFRGAVDKYTWVDVGSSYVPSEIASAFLFAQLEMLEPITERRRRIFNRYYEAFSELEEAGLLRRPCLPSDCDDNRHMFYVLLKDMKTRDALMSYLRTQEIHAVFHYIPLHDSPMGRKFGGRTGDLPITENVSARLLRLPFFNDLSEAHQTKVIEHVTEFLKGART